MKSPFEFYRNKSLSIYADDTMNDEESLLDQVKFIYSAVD